MRAETERRRAETAARQAAHEAEMAALRAERDRRMAESTAAMHATALEREALAAALQVMPRRLPWPSLIRPGPAGLAAMQPAIRTAPHATCAFLALMELH